MPTGRKEGAGPAGKRWGSGGGLGPGNQEFGVLSERYQEN